MTDLKTAILIFAHSAEQEAINKPFLHSQSVFQSLNDHTLQIVQQTQLPYFVVNETKQVGATFGARFTNAMQAVFDVGYDALIVIGNDTPHLTSSQLHSTKANLEANKVVLGESHNGGFYLLGIKKTHFKAESFLELPWQSQQLSKKLSQLLQLDALDICLLKKLQDINDVDDIKKIVCFFKKVYRWLFQLFLIITFQKGICLKHFSLLKTKQLTSTSYNKGSPLFI